MHIEYTLTLSLIIIIHNIIPCIIAPNIFEKFAYFDNPSEFNTGKHII